MEVLLLSSLEPAVSAGVGEPGESPLFSSFALVVQIKRYAANTSRNKIGELFLKGPNVALGYWQNPEATKETFGWEFEGAGGGWMRTGDRVRSFFLFFSFLILPHSTQIEN
jgi:long-subunit acyl-CoA synthetase (AMP-forming)